MMKMRLVERFNIRMSFDESTYIARGKIILVIANCNFHKRYGSSHDDSDIQIFVSCRNHCKSPFRYTRCTTRFITRRCSAEENNIYKELERIQVVGFKHLQTDMERRRRRVNNIYMKCELLFVLAYMFRLTFEFPSKTT